MAAEEELTIADAERWVIARGLKAYYEEGERPEKVRPIAQRVVLPWGEGGK